RRAARVPRRRSDRRDRDGRALARAGGSALLLGGRGVRPVVPRPARERRPRDAARRVHPRAHGGGGLGRHRGAPLLVPRSRDDPLTGPVRVNGARPGDVLVVEIVEVRPRASFGWTAIRPGRGLLPEAEFAKPFLQIWDLADGTHARMGHGIAVPIEPFPGVM